jgi:hypothetical protein
MLLARKQLWTLCRFAVLGVLSICIVSAQASAATKADKQKEAEQLVQEALQNEIYGLTAERDRLLEKASEQAPDYAPARWHQGYVKFKNKWLRAVELPQFLQDDKRFAQYEKIREGHGDDLAGHLELANWCSKRALNEQERAHLSQVLRFDPNHLEARGRLGFLRIDGEWMHRDEIGETVDQLRNDRKALATWRPQIERLTKALHHRGELKREAAKKQILEIHDPSAIPALEAVLARDSQESAELAVETMNSMPTRQASLALSRQAITSPWPIVREAAAAALKGRPEDAYVPSLLATLYSPVQSKMQVTRGRRGTVLYRHAFFREGQGENELLVADTEFRRVGNDPAARRDSGERAMQQIRQRMQANAIGVAEQNRRTEEMNARVMRTLSVATGQQLPATPDSWWEWWNEHNEIFVEGTKQTRTLTRTEQVSIADRTLTLQGSGGGSQLTKDCLAAGTNVWTAGGPVAIDKLKAGDLVLAQESATGELSYKPVLQTTVRPASALVELKVGGEIVRTSGGHPFWVAGEGWIKARDLKAGMELHGVNGSVLVQSVERIHEEKTYNLIVADFNSYFVGDSMVLSHDNTLRESTDAAVPGLKP